MPAATAPLPRALPAPTSALPRRAPRQPTAPADRVPARDALGRVSAGDTAVAHLIPARDARPSTPPRPSLSSAPPPAPAATARLRIGSLSSLRHLDLSRNRFYRPVPARLANLSSPVHLNLSRNNFTSGVPTDGIQQLCRVVTRRNTVYDTFVVSSAFAGERAVDYDVHKIWKMNNLGVTFLFTASGCAA